MKNIPEGFEAYAGDLRHKASKLLFEGSQYPTLPLLGYGEVWHSGWDIPTRWAVDAKKQAWMDNAHGHPLQPVSADTLVGTAEEEDERAEMREVLGLAPVLSPMDVLRTQMEELLMSLSSEEAAKVLGVSLPDLIGKMGSFPGAYQTPLGYWRFPHKEVLAVKAKDTPETTQVALK